MSRRSIMTLLTVCAALSAAASIASAQEWTRFRGPNGSGVSDATTVPTSWTEKDYNWQIELPGEGNSSPVVWGDKLFVTSADVAAGRRYVLCINTTDGAVLWKRDFKFDKYRKHKNNSFASNTPAVDADHVYVLFQSPDSSPLIALDHAGQPVWEYDLGPYNHGQGGATSPIVFGDQIFVGNDHAKGSFLLAVDRNSGKEQWKVPRAGKRACYATPCVYQAKGRPAEIIFSHCFEGIRGLDAKTGKEMWMIDVFGTFPQRAVGSPIVAGDLIIANSGARVADKNVVAVRLKSTDTGGIEVKEAYRLTRAAPHVPTPLVYGQWLFMWSDSGIVTCAKAHTGEQVWQKRVGGNYFGSPVCVGGRLYCIDLDGNVVVLAASDKFEELARTPLGSGSRSTPAISNGVMYLRTLTHLYSIGGKAK